MARCEVDSCSSSGGGRASAAEERIFVIESKTIPLAALGKKSRGCPKQSPWAWHIPVI
jgi:hypothetical protein